MQEHRIDSGKNRGVRSDRQSECQDRDEAEARASQKLA
jgi:hypothetical protein